MDRLDGGREALSYIRGLNSITPPTTAFDAAFSTE